MRGSSGGGGHTVRTGVLSADALGFSAASMVPAIAASRSVATAGTRRQPGMIERFIVNSHQGEG